MSVPSTQTNGSLVSPRLIAVGSGRGGSGKTTVALGLAHALAASHGRRIALVDLDHQGSLTLYAGSRPVADPLAAPPVAVHGVSLYRGGEPLAHASAGQLIAHLRRAEAEVDGIVADLPPSLTDPSHAAVFSRPADLLVIVAELEPGSLQPASKLRAMAEIAGVPVMVLPNKDNARGVSGGTLMVLQGAFGAERASVSLKDLAAAPESISKRKPVTAYKPKAPISQAIFAVARDLVEAGAA
jgi:cellulose biosynthesis protein BcsQ